MNCPKCGAETHPQALFCPKCRATMQDSPGTNTPPPQAQPSPTTPVRPMPQTSAAPMYGSDNAQNSSMAIAAFILSVVGIFTCGLLVVGDIVAIILAIVALVQIQNSAGRLKGSGFAIAALCITVLTLLVWTAVLAPVFMKGRSKAKQASCMSNQRMIATSILMYCQDHNGAYPASLNDVKGYLGGEPNVLHCLAADSSKTISYGYNSMLIGAKEADLTNPVNVVCTADGGNDANRITSPSDISMTIHQQGFIVSYADGRVKWYEANTPVELTIK